MPLHLVVETRNRRQPIASSAVRSRDKNLCPSISPASRSCRQRARTLYTPDSLVEALVIFTKYLLLIHLSPSSTNQEIMASSLPSATRSQPRSEQNCFGRTCSSSRPSSCRSHLTIRMPFCCFLAVSRRLLAETLDDSMSNLNWLSVSAIWSTWERPEFSIGCDPRLAAVVLMHCDKELTGDVQCIRLDNAEKCVLQTDRP